MSLLSLQSLRTKHIGLSPSAVARAAAIPAARLEQIEAGDVMQLWEAEALAKVYGIDADTLSGTPILLEPGDLVAALPLVDEFQEVDGEVKLRILSAARAARDLYDLRERLGEEDPWIAHNQLQSFKKPKAGCSPHEAGRYYAEQLRSRLNLGTGPIQSVRDLIAEAFPHITLLYAHLGSPSLSGVALGDAVRGPTVLLNLDGKNQNPCVRRFSLLHELYHLLLDLHQGDPLVTLSGFLQDAGLDRERRANAFATRLLCPEKVLQQAAAKQQNPLLVAGRLMQEFGIHYGAARLYLRNVAGLELPHQPPVHLVDSANSLTWQRAEEPTGVDDFPIPAVPKERRTAVARRASVLYSRGDLSRDRYADYLGVTPAEDIERVVGFFGLDLPDDG